MSITITDLIFDNKGLQITGQSFLDGKLIDFTVGKTIDYFVSQTANKIVAEYNSGRLTNIFLYVQAFLVEEKRQFTALQKLFSDQFSQVSDAEARASLKTLSDKCELITAKITDLLKHPEEFLNVFGVENTFDKWGVLKVTCYSRQ
jgi:uncharacterized protein YwgA